MKPHNIVAVLSGKTRRRRKYKKRLMDRKIDYVKQLRKNGKCFDCESKSDLEFHHRDPSTKYKTICSLAHDHSTFLILEKELSKCDLLCNECHKKKHSTR